jgi:hypothetical protein
MRITAEQVLIGGFGLVVALFVIAAVLACFAQVAWGCQPAPSRSMALSVVIILRMTATRMTLGFLRSSSPI